MQPALATPGYLYVLAHPDLRAWHKVGRTYRPPHVRAAELSTTAWPSPFEVAHARFFWDTVSAERTAHQILHRASGRRREFFDAPLSVIRAVIDTLPSPVLQVPPPAAPETWGDEPWASRVGDADAWSASLDRRAEEWAQGAHEVAQSDPRVQAQGWRRWMRLSAEGWAQGSWDLAEQLVHAHPGPEGVRRATWVFEAADIQGGEGGHLRAAWIRSLLDDAALPAWSAALQATWHRYADRPYAVWPEAVRATLQMERDLCAQHPLQAQKRAQADSGFGGWDAVVQA
jgi:hypothetical protein